jgi:hypothetical protein
MLANDKHYYMNDGINVSKKKGLAEKVAENNGIHIFTAVSYKYS